MMLVMMYAALWFCGAKISEALNGPIKEWRKNATHALIALVLALVLAAFSEPD
jgi:hypothetical protein